MEVLYYYSLKSFPSTYKFPSCPGLSPVSDTLRKPRKSARNVNYTWFSGAQIDAEAVTLRENLSVVRFCM